MTRNMPETINGTVESIKDEMAVIKTENDEKLFWPIKNLPPGLTVGAKVNLTLSTEQNSETEEKVQAKKMLNDILNVQPERDDR